jgi:hypothetical protein
MIRHLCCRGFVRALLPILRAISSRTFGRRGIGNRLRIGSAADVGTWPGKVVGAPARCNNGFAVIEHSRGKRIGLPFIRMAWATQKLVAFFRVGRI